MANTPNGAPWFHWIPSWMPICAAILSATWFVAQYTQNVNDRLRQIEQQIHEMRQYLQSKGMPSFAPSSFTNLKENSDDIQSEHTAAAK